MIKKYLPNATIISVVHRFAELKYYDEVVNLKKDWLKFQPNSIIVHRFFKIKDAVSINFAIMKELNEK